MSNSNISLQNKSILFVCMGNTCRSPIAEAIFLHLIKQNGVENEWTVDSAGIINYHAGKDPNPNAKKVLGEKGIIKYEHKARQIRTNDFFNFDWIICMDEWNLEELQEMKPINTKAKIHKLGEFLERNGQNEVVDIRDPYFDNDDKAFYQVYDQCWTACLKLLKSLYN